MLYFINEIFYSLQGEGAFSGTPAIFIRLARCNLSCKWCDTNHYPKMYEDEDWIIEECKQVSPHCRRIVITGGEPTVQDLHPLLNYLKLDGYTIHIETNGTNPLPSIGWDWITVSPKHLEGLNIDTISKANEIKVVCGSEYWEELVEVFNKKNPLNSLLYLIPLDEGKGNRMNDHWIAIAKDYCLANPNWRLSPQMQKLLNFK